MTIKPFDFKLKDGRTATILSPRDQDINGVIEYLKISAAETEFILRYPEECDKYTYEAEKAIFDRMNASEDEAMLICLVDGKVAGNCGIHFSNKLKTRHRAGVAIALCKEFWNLGIGTRMFEEMEKLALTKPYVQILELDFVEGNTRARALYEKMGFKIIGRRPSAICLKDGTLLDEYMMQKKLSR